MQEPDAGDEGCKSQILSGVGDFGDELCKLPDCVLTGVDGVRVVTFHERYEACHQVVHVLERPRRLAIPVDGNVLSLQRLRVPLVRQQAHAALQHNGTTAQRHCSNAAPHHYTLHPTHNWTQPPICNAQHHPLYTPLNQAHHSQTTVFKYFRGAGSVQ